MSAGRVLLVIALACGVAHAEDRALAERYFRAGEKAYQAQNFAAAASNFEEAYKHFALPEIAFSAAQAYRRQYRIDPKPEQLKRAIDLYRIYLDKVKTGGRVADAADALGEMQHELDKLIASGVKVSAELAAEHTRVVVAVTLGKPTGSRGMHEVEEGATAEPPAKIKATLDGKPVEPFAPTNVAPGSHVVRAEADGYFPAEKEEVVAQGTTAMADLTLEPKPAKVTIKTEAGARISVDGRPAGTAPLAALELAAGRHLVTILRRGREPIAREITVARGESLEVPASLAHTVRRKTVPWLLGGAGVALVFTGLSTTLAFVKDGEAQDLLADIEDGDEPRSTVVAYDRARDWRRRYTVGAITGGGIAVGLASVALLLYYTDTPSPEGVRVEPLVTRDAGGAALSGRF